MTTNDNLIERLQQVINDLVGLFSDFSETCGKNHEPPRQVSKSFDDGGKLLSFSEYLISQGLQAPEGEVSETKNDKPKRKYNKNKQIALNIFGYDFTEKEIKSMPRKFRTKINGLSDHVRLKPNGSYEVRYMIRGIAYSGCGSTIELAKKRFIKNLAAKQEEENPTPRARAQKPKKAAVLFTDFAERWFEEVKKVTVKPITYNSYVDVYARHIKPFFKKTTLESVTPLMVQPLINKMIKSGKTKVANIVKVLLNQIFEAAVDERLVSSNPITRVKTVKHIAKRSKILDLVCEREFMESLHGTEYELTYALMLYTGCRRSELASAELKGDFISIKCGKQKIGMPEIFREIPITPMLAPYLAGVTKKAFKAAVSFKLDRLDRVFKRNCPDHHLHELRHTFVTRCQECGVPREVVSVWAGHASDNTMTSNIYTHFSPDFMQKMGKLVDYSERLKPSK